MGSVGAAGQVPVGHGQVRGRGWWLRCSGVLARGGGRVDLQQGGAGRAVGHGALLVVFGALPQMLVWDREGACTPATGARPASYAGVLRAAAGATGTSASRQIRQAKGASSGCRGIWRRTSSPAGGSRTTLDFQLQLDAWFEKANARTHRDVARSAGRPARARSGRGDAAAARARAGPDRRWVIRVPPDPYSARSTPTTTRWIPASSAVVSRCASPSGSSPRPALDSGELAARHERSFAQAPHDHRARARPGAEGAAAGAPAEVEVEQRRLPAMTR